MPDEPVVIDPRTPVLSRAGRVLVALLVAWLVVVFVAAYAADAFDLTKPAVLRILVLVLAVGPLVALYFAWVTGHIGFWGHRVQPRIVVDEDGLTLRLPTSVERRFGWDEIGGMRGAWNHADLLDRHGAPIARIPRSLLLAAGTRWQREHLATVVVGVRPDLYELESGRRQVPDSFVLRGASDPTT